MDQPPAGYPEQGLHNPMAFQDPHQQPQYDPNAPPPMMGYQDTQHQPYHSGEAGLAQPGSQAQAPPAGSANVAPQTQGWNNQVPGGHFTQPMQQPGIYNHSPTPAHPPHAEHLQSAPGVEEAESESEEEEEDEDNDDDDEDEASEDSSGDEAEDSGGERYNAATVGSRSRTGAHTVGERGGLRDPLPPQQQQPPYFQRTQQQQASQHAPIFEPDHAQSPPLSRASQRGRSRAGGSNVFKIPASDAGRDDAAFDPYTRRDKGKNHARHDTPHESPSKTGDRFQHPYLHPVQPSPPQSIPSPDLRIPRRRENSRRSRVFAQDYGERSRHGEADDYYDQNQSFGSGRLHPGRPASHGTSSCGALYEESEDEDGRVHDNSASKPPKKGSSAREHVNLLMDYARARSGHQIFRSGGEGRHDLLKRVNGFWNECKTGKFFDKIHFHKEKRSRFKCALEDVERDARSEEDRDQDWVLEEKPSSSVSNNRSERSGRPRGSKGRNRKDHTGNSNCWCTTTLSKCGHKGHRREKHICMRSECRRG
jgi:hypothetical protein